MFQCFKGFEVTLEAFLSQMWIVKFQFFTRNRALELNSVTRVGRSSLSEAILAISAAIFVLLIAAALSN
jgi:hypothetical protein